MGFIFCGNWVVQVTGRRAGMRNGSSMRKVQTHRKEHLFSHCVGHPAPQTQQQWLQIEHLEPRLNRAKLNTIEQELWGDSRAVLWRAIPK